MCTSIASLLINYFQYLNNCSVKLTLAIVTWYHKQKLRINGL